MTGPQPLRMPLEPPADMRKASKSIFDLFRSLMEAGFTEQQALVVIGTMLGTSAAGYQGDRT